MTLSSKRMLGDVLVQYGFLEERGRAAALAHSRTRGTPIGRACVELGLLSPLHLWQALALHTGAPTAHLDGRELSEDVLALLPARLAFLYRCVPLAVEAGPRGALVLAVDGPRSPAMLDEIAFATGRRVKLVVAPEDALWRALRRSYPADGDRGCGFNHVVDGYFELEE